MLPRHARCVLSRLCCNGHSLLLGSYLSRIGRIENPSCSACGHSSQDISHVILHCPATDSLRRSLFGDSLSLYNLWSRPWGVSRLLGLHGLPPCPHPSEGSGNQQQQQLHQLNANSIHNNSPQTRHYFLSYYRHFGAIFGPNSLMEQNHICTCLCANI